MNERNLPHTAAMVRAGRESFQVSFEAAQRSPADAADLEARIESADSVHGMVFMALLCEKVEPVRARLARLTEAAADPPAEAARLIQAEGLPLGVEFEVGPRGITAVAAAAVFGNAPVLRFFLAQPGVEPEGWEVYGQTLLSFAAMVGKSIDGSILS